ncbi:MAG: DUF2461 domain-containing protein [Calditrichaeota bacterium]|nr:MAG: DUF2461 domain-containing protein [Calditrichota bacterium]
MEPVQLPEALFRFLSELKKNNNREWFQRNKTRYEREVRGPVLQLIAWLADPIGRLSSHIVVDPRPHGGSMFRIYRDTRFSPDKSPYKTHVGVQFRHEGARDAHAPGFYFHLEPGRVMAAAGIWRPDSRTTYRIRQAIAEQPDVWQKATAFLSDRFQLVGDSLKRPPRGFPPNHPLMADLKRKEFIAVTHFAEAEACSPQFPGQLAGAFRRMSPLVRFVCHALQLPF